MIGGGDSHEPRFEGRRVGTPTSACSDSVRRIRRNAQVRDSPRSAEPGGD